MRYFEIEQDIQRSYIKAWCCIFGFILGSLITAMIIISLLPEKAELEGALYTTWTAPAGRPLGSASGAGSSFHGQRGVAVKITKDGGSLKPTIIEYEGKIINEEIYQEEDFNSGTGRGSVHTASLGHPLSDLFSLPNSPDRILTSSPIKLAYRVSPEYPWVAREAGKEGKVVIKLLIDVNGKPIPFDGKLCEVISEEPRDWFFAQKLLEVIEYWRFVPHIEDGRPMDYYLELCYTYGIARSGVELLSHPNP